MIADGSELSARDIRGSGPAQSGPDFTSGSRPWRRRPAPRSPRSSSAFPDTGQYGIGSEKSSGSGSPRVLLAAGEGIDQTAFGSIWFYFEQELGIAGHPGQSGGHRGC